MQRYVPFISMLIVLALCGCRQEQADVRERAQPAAQTSSPPPAPDEADESAAPAGTSHDRVTRYLQTVVFERTDADAAARSARASLADELGLQVGAPPGAWIDALELPASAVGTDLRAALEAVAQLDEPAMSAQALDELLDRLGEHHELDPVVTRLRFLHGLRALQAGLAPGGTSGFGLLYGPICPQGSWLGEVAAFGVVEAVSGVHDQAIDAELRGCWKSACPAVEGAADLAQALSQCEAASLPAVVARQRALQGGRGLLGALTVARLMDDARTLGPDASAFELATHGLTFDAPIELTVLPTLPLRAGLVENPDDWIDVEAAPTQLNAWPQLELRDGELRPSFAGALIAPDPTIGLVAPAATSVARLREVLRATRDDEAAEVSAVRSLAVRGRGGRLQWLAIDSSPAIVGDVLVREADDGGSLTVWLAPGRVDTLAASGGAVDGEVLRIEAPDGLASALIALHHRLAAEPVSRLIVDLRDEATVGELAAIIDVVDHPRAGVEDAVTASALLAASARDAGHTRLERIVVTEHRTAPLPLDAPQDTPP